MPDRCTERQEAVLERWARRWLKHLSGLWSVPLTNARVEVSTRMRRGLGRCYPARGLIRLNWRLCQPGYAEQLRQTLIHEAAHLAAWRLGDRGAPHGHFWQQLMRAAGQPIRATASGDFQWPQPRNTSVRLECQDCGVVFHRRRSDRRWRCRACLQSGRQGRLRTSRLAG